jgi:hypothetical protein
VAEILIHISDETQKIIGLCLGGVVLVLVFLSLWLSGTFHPKYRLRLYAPDVGGLSVGAEVKLDNTKVGSISSIEIAHGATSPDRSIELGLLLDKRYQEAIRTESTATVMLDAPLGDPYLNIHRSFSGDIIASGGEVKFVPNNEPRFKDFADLASKLVNCSQTAKDSPEKKSLTPPGSSSKAAP